MTRKCVLIVEDDDWLARQQAKVVRAADYEVFVAPHALAAIDMINKIKPAVIVLDMLLAGYNAITLMHELQSYNDTAAIPIILCTNIASSIKLEDIKPYGVHRILDKTTMQPDDIVVAIRSVIEL
jgi:CheY-like chemotaxis protein